MANKEWLSRAMNLDIKIKALQRAKQAAFEVAHYQSPSFSEQVQTDQSNTSETRW